MVQLLVIREKIKNFIGKYEGYVRPAARFCLCLITMLLINGTIGFASKLSNVAIAIIISLLASFLPTTFIIIASALVILLHLYSLALECVIVVGVLFILMFLLYYRFAPNDTLLLLFTPILFALKIPYVAPLAAGLVSGASAVVSIGCGTIVYYVLNFISQNSNAFESGAEDSMLVNLRFLLESIIGNKEMMVIILAFSFTIIVVNIIRRLSVDHAWTIAIITGTLSDILIVLIGDLKYGTYISLVGLILGSFVAVLVVCVIKFFVFNVDYSRTEKVQFEDDEYYYYVKAVPKNNVTIQEKTVKHIKNTAVNRNDVPQRRREPKEKDAVEYKMRRSVNSSGRQRMDGSGMTEIERAAAAKARAQRANKNNK